MDARTKKRLEQQGWKIGSAQEFLGLRDDEMELIRLRERLAGMLENVRARKGLSQTEVAAVCGTSQANVSRMESRDPSVTLDRLLRTLVGLGATAREIGHVLSNSPSS